MNGGFAELNIPKSSWMNGCDEYRLVDKGAGPLELQVRNPLSSDNEWKPESSCYTHSVLCFRIIELEKACVATKTALGDALSAFNNEEGQTTIVNEERLEAWESALMGG